MHFKVVLADSFVDEKSIGLCRGYGTAVPTILVLLVLGILLLGIDRVGSEAVCAVRVLAVGVPLALEEELNIGRSQGCSRRLGRID